MRKYCLITKALLILVVFGAFFSSCVPIKKQIYLQTYQDSSKLVFKNNMPEDYKLQPGNNLHIQISSIDKQSYEFFNMGLGAAGNVYYDAAIYLNSYSVDDSGYIELPFIGKILVENYTTKEAKNLIQLNIDQYLKNTLVIVKLVNYNVTLVGEVVNPGQYKVYQNNINIFEMLAIAGDLTTYAKRDDIIIVRRTKAGSKMHHIDLLNEELLESEFFYLMPDDLIYIKPVRGKNFAFASFPYALIISSISLGIALFALFK